MVAVNVALSILKDAVEKKHNAGEVPVFLGVHGMLALMYNDIVEFSKLPEEERSKFVLSLAVKSVFALATTLPDIAEMDDVIPDEMDDILEDEEEKPLQENPDIADEEAEEDTEDASRWAPRPDSKPSTTNVVLKKKPKSDRMSHPEMKAMTDNDDEDGD